MKVALRFARWVVTAAIFALMAVSFVPREAANHLVSLQKLLTRMIEGES